MIRYIIALVENLKTTCKSLKPWVHGFNIFIFLHSKELIMMYQLVSFSFFNMFVSFIGRVQRFKYTFGHRYVHNLCIFWMWQSIHKNTTHYVMFLVVLPLCISQTLSIYHNTFCINFKIYIIFNDVLQLIINTYDMVVHLTLPLGKMSNISIKIVVLLKSGSICNHRW